MYYSDFNRPNPTPPQETWQEATVVETIALKKKKTWPKLTALLLVCALVGGGAGVGGALLTQNVAGGGSSVIYQGGGTPTPITISQVTPGRVMTGTEVYASNLKSVVGIRTQVTTNVFGQTVSGASAGSGFVLTTDGYVVTNHHVIEDATTIKVSFADGQEYDATLVGSDEANDVAVLKINATGLIPVVIGSSDDLLVGEQVAAIGNPLGELTYSYTSGYVSALDRNITMSDGSVMNMLQTDTAINSGNSGGPLFNMYGQVVGITTAKYSSSGSSSSASVEGIGFAIPINNVADIFQDLITHGYVKGRPSMGITVSTAVASEAARYGRSGGAYVSGVVAGSCTEKAGLQQGDIITKMGDVEIDGSATLIETKGTFKAGDTTTLTVDRGGEMITLTLTFDEETPENTAAGQRQQEQQEQQQQQDQNDSYSYRFPFSW